MIVYLLLAALLALVAISFVSSISGYNRHH
jgi:hypothetical protein